MKRRPLSIWHVVVLALFPAISESPSSAELIVIGPGPVATPFDRQGPEFQLLAGSELVATATRLSPDGEQLFGGKAIFAYGSSWVVDGGLVVGATVTTQPGLEYAYGGTAIDLYSPSNYQFVFHDGVVRGGSVIVDPSSPASGRGGPAFQANRQTNLQMAIYGGLFEGGTVSLASSPEVLIERAPALNLTNDYGGQVDIHGGTFVGGIRIKEYTNLPVHGNNLELQPPIDGLIPRGQTDFTISGAYFNGVPFSHSIHIDPADLAAIDRGPGYLTFCQVVPEPGGIVLAASCLAPSARRRRLSRDGFRPRPAMGAGVTGPAIIGG